jgi:hypothetical protein
MLKMITYVALALLLISCVDAQVCRQAPQPCDNTTVVPIQSGPIQYDGAHKFSRCFTLLKTHFCVKYEAQEQSNLEFMNITLSVTVDDVPVWKTVTTWPDLYKSDGICIDDATVMEILMLVPSLNQYETLFSEILTLVGCLPAGLFSLCFQAAPNQCLNFDVEFLFFEQYCVFTSSTPIGCH